jgi:inositol 1,4,5-triphosphate receptor type 1/inositol 1,4,5-triphosphate receptor type 3
MISHHLKKNVGCIDFLKEMYDNNKTMLFNEANLLKFVKEICTTIENEPEHSFYKSKLLDFFRFLIYCNGKSLKFNQIQILKVMQDDSYKKIILNVTKQDI